MPGPEWHSWHTVQAHGKGKWERGKIEHNWSASFNLNTPWYLMIPDAWCFHIFKHIWLDATWCWVTWQDFFYTCWYFVIQQWLPGHLIREFCKYCLNHAVCQAKPELDILVALTFIRCDRTQSDPCLSRLCLTFADLETLVCHDLGSFKCQACQV